MAREEDFIKKMQSGDHTAMEKLISLYYPAILRYCLWHAPTPALAEDAVQETFLKMIRFFDHYQHRGNFKAFLYQIAANTCIDLRRKKWLRDVPLCETGESRENLGADSWISQETSLEELQGDLEFKALIGDLPEDSKEILLLRFAQDLTLREIAQVTQLPLRTAQSRLRSGLKQMKRKLEKEGCGQ